MTHDDEEKRNNQIEEQLRSKITSTMTVSTFLAGFTFAILNDLLKTKCFNVLQIVAAISMTVSLFLFIASLYMYDNMAMPKEYWSVRRDSQCNNVPIIWLLLREINCMTGILFLRKSRKCPHYKLLHDYMICTWNLVFTPGVICFIIGFMAILFNTGFNTGKKGMIVAVAGGVSIIIVFVFYLFKRIRFKKDTI